MLLSQKDTRVFIALFLISIAEIAFEITIMRIFSIGGWSNFGGLVISTALLAIGISGILLTVWSEKIKERALPILRISALVLAPFMSLSIFVAQNIPFNPQFLANDPRQIWFLISFVILYVIPFFAGAFFIGTVFLTLSHRVRGLYFWNMTGSGLGGFFIILCMFVFPPNLLPIPILVLAIFASMVILLNKVEGEKFKIRLMSAIGLILALLISFGVTIFAGKINVSEFKAISYVKKYPDPKLVHHSYGPSGEYHVYASSYLHFAPGLSDNSALKIKAMPKQPFWALYIDGNGPIGITGSFTTEESEYLDYLPMTAPYILKAKPNVMLVNLGGGLSTTVALHNNASNIDIVEPTSELISLLRDDPNVSKFNDNLLQKPNVHVHEGDPRAFASTKEKNYDLIEIGLVDSIGLTNIGGYPIVENYTYTKQAFTEYMNALKPGGLLSITVWDNVTPPRNVLRIMTTLVESLKEAGVKNIGKTIFSYNLLRSTATIIVKKGEFTEGEMYDLRNFVTQKSFDVIHDPLSANTEEISFDELLAAYNTHFSNSEAKDSKSFNAYDMYKASFNVLFAPENETVTSPKVQKLYDDYVFDIKPISDDRPYYAGYLKVDRMDTYLDQMSDISEEWGELLIFGVLIVAIIFGLIVMFLPMALKWKTLFADRRGTIGVMVYYACLGLAYMLIELFLIQRLSIYLSNPTYSTAIVITFMLVFSAFGNIVADKVKIRPDILVIIACTFIVGGITFYIFGLDGFLASSRSESLPIRILVTLGIVAPLAFFLGIPYPTGLHTLSKQRPALIPWAWGMNGGLSVAGASLARVVSVTSGFLVLLLIPILLYIIVAVLFRVNGFVGNIKNINSLNERNNLIMSYLSILFKFASIREMPGNSNQEEIYKKGNGLGLSKAEIELILQPNYENSTLIEMHNKELMQDLVIFASRYEELDSAQLGYLFEVGEKLSIPKKRLAAYIEQFNSELKKTNLRRAIARSRKSLDIDPVETPKEIPEETSYNRFE